jgi:hypothetical protein
LLEVNESLSCYAKISSEQSAETPGHGVPPSSKSKQKSLSRFSHAEHIPRLQNAPSILPLTHENLSENNRLYASTSERRHQGQFHQYKAGVKSLDLDQVLSMGKSLEGMMPMERFLAEIGDLVGGRREGIGEFETVSNVNK